MQTPFFKPGLSMGLLLLAGILFWQCNAVGEKEPGSLFEQYYEPYPAPAFVNGEEGDEERETWNRASKLYKEGDFIGAIEGFKIALEGERPPDETANFYLGVSHLELSPPKPKEAIPYFNAVIKERKGKYFEIARWYRALSYLNWGKISETRIMLERIKQESEFKQEEATKLLTQLPVE